MILDSLFYEKLLPHELLGRVASCPVAYLPLGTLEWHGPHMPLGADGLQARALFERLAEKIGGVIFPMLFLGPDMVTLENGKELYGMDVCGDNFTGAMHYENQQLPGSCYWLEETLYESLLKAICKQLSRTGFRILVAHGHGPSVLHFQKIYEEMEKTYSLICMDAFNPEENYYLGMQVDHGGANETSIMLAADAQLVEMDRLPKDMSKWPLAIGMGDPRTDASRILGEEILEYQSQRLAGKIEEISI